MRLGNALSVKYAVTHKNKDNLCSLDVADHLIKYMADNKISISDMADKLKMEEPLINKFWLRKKLPTEGQAKVIMKGLMNG